MTGSSCCNGRGMRYEENRVDQAERLVRRTRGNLQARDDTQARYLSTRSERVAGVAL